MSVAIVDYGSGNLHSAQKAFERAVRDAGMSRQVKVTSKPEDVLAADQIVLPGVGAFADCRRGLDAVDGMVEAITEAVRVKARPFFGICVGMQLMASRGKEHVITEGLNWISGIPGGGSGFRRRISAMQQSSQLAGVRGSQLRAGAPSKIDFRRSSGVS
ncbi:MAG: hypothetical protein KGO22_13765 [Gammaproteobacteria bacterium]|nr:hypothetical protein [Gammaproteobacteria bacterium]